MNFRQYLREAFVEDTLMIPEGSKPYETEASLVLHKIIDMLDHGHVEMGEDGSKISFNVGQLIKKSPYKNLNVIIRKKDGKPKVRFGFSKNTGQLSIVIDTPKLPERHNIDDFLHKTEMADSFKKAFVEYLDVAHDPDGFNEHEPTNHEKKKTHNDRKTFEQNYAALVNAVKKATKKFESSAIEAQNHIGDTAHAGKKEMFKLSIRQLATEFLGNNLKEFIKVVHKLPEAEFIGHLETELKKKIQTRLEDYFEDRIHPLIKKHLSEE